MRVRLEYRKVGRSHEKDGGSLVIDGFIDGNRVFSINRPYPPESVEDFVRKESAAESEWLLGEDTAALFDSAKVVRVGSMLSSISPMMSLALLVFAFASGTLTGWGFHEPEPAQVDQAPDLSTDRVRRWVLGPNLEEPEMVAVIFDRARRERMREAIPKAVQWALEAPSDALRSPQDSAIALLSDYSREEIEAAICEYARGHRVPERLFKMIEERAGR